MVIRFIIRYLSNNEHLIERLSQSYPMRRTARFVVYMINRSKLLAEEKGLPEQISAENLKQFARKFSNNLKQELTKAKERYDKKQKF